MVDKIKDNNTEELPIEVQEEVRKPFRENANPRKDAVPDKEQPVDDSE